MNKKSERQKRRRESQVFKSKIRKETLEARRKSYRLEAIVRAEEEGKAKARKPKFSSQILKTLGTISKPKKVSKKKKPSGYKPFGMGDLF